MRVKEEYPLHNLAILAEIGLADCYYSDKEYSEAENAYNDLSLFTLLTRMFPMPSTKRVCASTTK